MVSKISSSLFFLSNYTKKQKLRGEKKQRRKKSKQTFFVVSGVIALRYSSGAL
jgi:hypothetical protein